MFSTDEFTLDCGTCLAANTTACSDCIVSHLLANDAGPIDLELVSMPTRRTDVDRVVDLFVRAGLADGRPEFVTQSEFDAGRAPVPA